MDTLSYKTVSANKATVTKEWVVIDATDQVLGRFASRIALILRGKHKPSYTPHVDCGYPGGQRFATPKELLTRKPLAVVEHAVKGMLPKNRLGAELFRNLFVYTGPEHPHEAQQPKEIHLNEI